MRRPARRSCRSGQQGEYLTTSAGARLYDTDHSLKAGERGPTLLQDHHLREKVMHFDHERIPERVVHARGYGAHGVFVGYGTAAKVCRAGFLGDGVETPVFVRFSTVVGSRGSADTVRDTRGFATKFYTQEGNFDLVGNNIPVFFIQDGIKFPDIIHAAKPHPDREIPQAQSAHDTFWDFVSTHTEATHHVMWNMSDRAIPRSYRTMEGFGVHTFRLVNADGETALAKFHWKPKLGVHSLVWEEAQMISGVDPDFHRRDLADAIESGAYPQWELGIQVFPDTPRQTFEGIDLLDPTKIVPEELAPVQPIGMLTLNRNPTNYFAETEQVAFHLGNLVPGIDVTDDPLFQARLFSYLDTQLTRLAGPNFNQIPINRPHAPVNDMFRDGFHQHAVHAGVAPYKPNTLDGGNPFEAGVEDRPFVEVAQPLPKAVKVRQAPDVVRRPLHAAEAVLAEPVAGGEGTRRACVHLRARQVLRAGDQGTRAAGAGQRGPRAVPGGGRRARPAGAGRHRAAEEGHAESRAVPDRPDVADRRAHHRDRGRPDRPRRRADGPRDHPGRRHGAAADRADRRAARRRQWPGRPAHVPHRPVGRVRRAAARGQPAARRGRGAGQGREGRRAGRCRRPARASS